jgi:hypothetical protein
MPENRDCVWRIKGNTGSKLADISSKLAAGANGHISL